MEEYDESVVEIQTINDKISGYLKSQKKVLNTQVSGYLLTNRGALWYYLIIVRIIIGVVWSAVWTLQGRRAIATKSLYFLMNYFVSKFYCHQLNLPY